MVFDYRKTIKDKLGYLHSEESLKKTEFTLANVKNGDVVSFTREKKDSGQGFAAIIMNGKEWRPHNSLRKADKTLLEYSAEGFDLEIVGHWLDGVEKGAFWNDLSILNLDLIDIMELNTTLEK